MKVRLRAQEIYTSKDCVFILKPPIDSKVSRCNSGYIIFFQKNLKGVKLRYHCIKTCHILPGGSRGLLPSAIWKLIHFADNDDAFRARQKLRGKVNAVSRKCFYISEILPSCEAEIKSAAKRMGVITITNSCLELVLTQKRCINFFVRVHEKEDVMALESQAVKRG